MLVYLYLVFGVNVFGIVCNLIGGVYVGIGIGFKLYVVLGNMWVVQVLEMVGLVGSIQLYMNMQLFVVINFFICVQVGIYLLCS